MVRTSRAWVAMVAVLSVIGVFVTIGCLLALRLEATGFGRPRDTGIRPAYAASLAVGAVAGLAVPVLVGLRFGDARPRTIAIAAVLAAGCAALAVVSILGMG